MAKTTTQYGLLDPTVPAEGFCGVYATDDGMVQIVSKHEGVTRIIEFTPEEWAGIAVGGIELGVIARSAAQAKKVPISPIKLSPQISALLGLQAKNG